MLLSKSNILAVDDLKQEDVPVPEWGGTVRLRTLTGTERDAFGQALMGTDGKADMTNYRARLLASCMVAEDGSALFSSAEVGALGAKSGAVLDRLFRVADRLNGLGEIAVGVAQGN